MAKKKYTYTKYEPFYMNQYSWGGDSSKALKNSFSSDKLGGTIGSIGGALTSSIGAGVSTSKLADTSEIEANINNSRNQTFSGSDNDQLIDNWSAWNPANKTNYKDVRGGSVDQRLMSTFGAGASGAASGAQVGGAFGAVGGTILGLGSSIAGMFVGDKKAKLKTQELNNQVYEANQQAFRSFGNSVDKIDSMNDQRLLANYSAYGGFINELANGGHTHGSQWDNGVTTFDNGNTHEANPNGGVMIGVDAEGTPNMVEEGEVRFNDYIFSNRIDVPKEMNKKYKLGDKVSFAEAAKKLSKESEERPNDPISKAGLDASMSFLTEAQEGIKQKKEALALKKQIAKMSPEEIMMMQQQMQQQPQQEQQQIPQDDQQMMAYGGKINEFKFGGLDPIPDLRFNLNSKPVQNPIGISDYSTNLLSQWAPKPSLNDFKSSNYGSYKGSDNQGSDNQSIQQKSSKLSNLRYAPAVGAGLGVFSDLMGWTNKPDYSSADMIANSTKNLSNIKFNPIGDYMKYQPMDRNYYVNQLHGNAGASRRSIENQSGGNRAQAMAGILASDYNSTSSMGKLARESEEYNLNQRAKVSDFNRATNMFNEEGLMKAGIANKSNEEIRLRSVLSQADIRNKADMMGAMGKTTNLTNLFDSLGDIGREEFSKNMILSNPALYYKLGNDGTVSYKSGYNELSSTEKAQVDKDIQAKKLKLGFAKGGYLTIKNK